MISWLSRLTGSSEPALRLLLSVLIAYPLALGYRIFLHHNKNITKSQTNLLFTLCGIMICVFNYGRQVWHSLGAVLFTYILIKLMYKSKWMVPISFSYHMLYLLTGYYVTSTENYDICWTMCHCVLVLHLIGLTFDVSDSIKKPEALGITDEREVKIPNFLEVFAFAYFPPTVIIGPQFSFKRYNDFIDKKFPGQHNLQHGLKRFATGLFYLAIFQIGLMIVPEKMFLSDEFGERNFLYKMFMLSIWGRTTLYKYISCWILSEGAATCCGLTFVSRDEKTGIEDWSGCANIKLRVFENTYKFHDYVAAFNVQTNMWVFCYVYKRLKFLNNKSISHISALMFLAIWHGFHSGYYVTFFLEFCLIHFEKEVEPLFKKNPKFMQFYESSILCRIAVFTICKLYCFIIAGYCLVPFAYLSFYKWWAIYKKFYFVGFIVILPMTFVWKPLIAKFVKIYFPLDKEKKQVEPVADGTDQKVNQHEKVN